MLSERNKPTESKVLPQSIYYQDPFLESEAYSKVLLEELHDGELEAAHFVFYIHVFGDTQAQQATIERLTHTRLKQMDRPCA